MIISQRSFQGSFTVGNNPKKIACAGKGKAKTSTFFRFNQICNDKEIARVVIFELVFIFEYWPAVNLRI